MTDIKVGDQVFYENNPVAVKVIGMDRFEQRLVVPA